MIELAKVDIDFIDYRLVYKSGKKIKMPRYRNNEWLAEKYLSSWYGKIRNRDSFLC